MIFSVNTDVLHAFVHEKVQLLNIPKATQQLVKIKKNKNEKYYKSWGGCQTGNEISESLTGRSSAFFVTERKAK